MKQNASSKIFSDDVQYRLEVLDSVNQGHTLFIRTVESIVDALISSEAIVAVLNEIRRKYQDRVDETKLQKAEQAFQTALLNKLNDLGFKFVSEPDSSTESFVTAPSAPLPAQEEGASVSHNKAKSSPINDNFSSLHHAPSNRVKPSVVRADNIPANISNEALSEGFHQLGGAVVKREHHEVTDTAIVRFDDRAKAAHAMLGGEIMRFGGKSIVITPLVDYVESLEHEGVAHVIPDDNVIDKANVEITLPETQVSQTETGNAMAQSTDVSGWDRLASPVVPPQSNSNDRATLELPQATVADAEPEPAPEPLVIRRDADAFLNWMNEGGARNMLKPIIAQEELSHPAGIEPIDAPAWDSSAAKKTSKDGAWPKIRKRDAENWQEEEIFRKRAQSDNLSSWDPCTEDPNHTFTVSGAFWDTHSAPPNVPMVSVTSENDNTVQDKKEPASPHRFGHVTWEVPERLSSTAQSNENTNNEPVFSSFLPKNDTTASKNESNQDTALFCLRNVHRYREDAIRKALLDTFGNFTFALFQAIHPATPTTDSLEADYFVVFLPERAPAPVTHPVLLFEGDTRNSHPIPMCLEPLFSVQPFANLSTRPKHIIGPCLLGCGLLSTVLR